MSHEIFGSDRVGIYSADKSDRGWHGLGTPIDDGLGAADACIALGFDDTVDQWQAGVQDPVSGEWRAAPGHVANMVKGKPAAFVSSGFQVVQNLAWARFVDSLASNGAGVVETCGTLREGKNVWFLMRAESYDLGAGDKVWQYLCCSNFHDATGSARLDPTDVRVVCANTQAMVVGRPGEWKRAAWSMRHTGDMAEKMAEAAEALRQYREQSGRFADRCRKLQRLDVTEKEAAAMWAKLYASEFTNPENPELTYKQRRRAEDARYRAIHGLRYRFRSEANKLGGANLWLALNAWTGWDQHDRQQSTTLRAEAHRQRKTYSRLYGAERDRGVRAMGFAFDLAAARVAAGDNATAS